MLVLYIQNINQKILRRSQTEKHDAQSRRGEAAGRSGVQRSSELPDASATRRQKQRRLMSERAAPAVVNSQHTAYSYI